MKKFTLLCTAILAGLRMLPAQDFCSLVHIPLSERIAAADVIVSAKLLRQECFRDVRDGRIYTRNFLVPEVAWKGFSSLPPVIEMVSEGGMLDGEGMSYTNTLMPLQGTEGVWFLYRDVAKGALLPYASLQGLLRKQEGVYFDYDGKRLGAASDFLALPEVRAERDEVPRPAVQAQPLRAGAISFSPKTAVAGIGQVLTITGSGFGNTRGNSYVAFNPYGMGFSDETLSATFRYISWNDTRIEVEIPSGYSTLIRVVSGSGAQESSDSLRILANVSMRQFNPADLFYLNNQNGAGGYFWTMHHDLRNNSDAKQAIEDVFRHFRCRTGVHYTLEQRGTSARFNLGDQVQSIAFDTAGSELASGVVARYEQLWSSCILGSETFYYVRAQDIRFSSRTNYYYGTGATPDGFAKFRYVLMHELGHSLQLGHVSEEGQTMHPIVHQLPAIKWNKRDSITREEVQAASFVVKQSRNFTFRACGLLPMLEPANCSDVYGSASEVSALPQQKIEIFPNPATDVLQIRGLNPGAVQFTIMSSDGKELRSGNVAAGRQIDLQGLAAGIFFLKLEMEGTSSVHRLVRQ